MELSERPLWQVGSGNTERSYGDICLKFDVMIAGPSEVGPFTKEAYSDYGDIKNSLRRFYVEARRNDLVLLRLGTGKILAVGVIADDDAAFLEAFTDIDGWDLRHVRRVRWFPELTTEFPVLTLGSRVRTFAAVNVPLVRDWVESLQFPEGSKERDLAVLPESGRVLDLPELGRMLFVEGLPREHVDQLMLTFSSLQRLAAWYRNKTKRPQGRPSEHETITYLVIPFLLSLGWSQQTAAIQWHYVDVALFSSMPPVDSTLACVVETKHLDRSVFQPVGQARDYALRLGRENCERLVVTDGIRYTFHRRKQDAFMLEAYLNILEPRDKYPALGCGGAVDAILGMAR